MHGVVGSFQLISINANIFSLVRGFTVKFPNDLSKTSKDFYNF